MAGKPAFTSKPCFGGLQVKRVNFLGYFNRSKTGLYGIKNNNQFTGYTLFIL